MNEQIDCTRALRQIQSLGSTLLSAPTVKHSFEKPTDKSLPKDDTYEASGVVTWSTDLLPVVQIGVIGKRTKGLKWITFMAILFIAINEMCILQRFSKSALTTICCSFFEVGKVENKRRKNPKEAELCKGTHNAPLRMSESVALNLLSVTVDPIYSWL